jgi:hypothetical protein
MQQAPPKCQQLFTNQHPEQLESSPTPVVRTSNLANVGLMIK